MKIQFKLSIIAGNATTVLFQAVSRNSFTEYQYHNTILSLIFGHIVSLLANSIIPDQTAPTEQSDQGLHCLPMHQQFYMHNASL